jgi:hypothetical protein
MHIISKRKGWTAFNILRTGICMVLSIGLALTATVATNHIAINGFMDSAWQLPSITISYFLVLVLTHVPHPPTLGPGRSKRGRYEEVEGQKGFNESHALDHLEVGKDDHHPRLSDFEDRRGGYTSTNVDIPETRGFRDMRAWII